MIFHFNPRILCSGIFVITNEDIYKTIDMKKETLNAVWKLVPQGINGNEIPDINFVNNFPANGKATERSTKEFQNEIETLKTYNWYGEQ